MRQPNLECHQVGFILYQVVNKWFALQAMADIPQNVENVRNLLNHPAFDLRNPNKVSDLHPSHKSIFMQM